MTASRWTAVAVAVVALLLLAKRADAAASARLLYVRGPGAESCPAEPAVRAAVRARLGYDPFFAWAKDTLFADIERDGNGFRATVKLVDDQNRQQGAREITVQGKDCTPVIDAVGLTVSLTLDPSSVIGERPAATTSLASTPPADPPPPEPSDAPSSPPSDASSTPVLLERPVVAVDPSPDAVTFHAGIGAIASLDAAPSPSAGGTLSLGAAWRSLSLDIEGRADVPAAGAGKLAAPAQARSWLLVGSVVPCAHLAFAFACPVLSFGTIGASAAGVAHSTESYGPWAAIGGRLGAAWEVAPRFTLGAYVEALAAIVRDSLQVDESLEYTVQPWSGGLGAGASWRFR